MEGEASHCSSVKTRSSHQTSREGEQGVEVQTTNQTIKIKHAYHVTSFRSPTLSHDSYNSVAQLPDPFGDSCCSSRLLSLHSKLASCERTGCKRYCVSQIDGISGRIPPISQDSSADHLPDHDLRHDPHQPLQRSRRRSDGLYRAVPLYCRQREADGGVDWNEGMGQRIRS